MTSIPGIWCIDNNMGVHYGKPHALVVGISVTINEHSIESVSAQKHLGITIDKKIDVGATDGFCLSKR